MNKPKPITEWGKMACVALGFAFGAMPAHIGISLAALIAFIVLGMVDATICDFARRGTK